MRSLIFASLMFVFISPVYSQTINHVQALSFLEGEWKGRGWQMGADRIKKEFQQHEFVEFQLGDQLMSIEGIGINQNDTIHHAFGIINYSDIQGHFNFRSHLTYGRNGDYKMELLDDVLYWYPKEGIRYVIKVDENGDWYEVGEIFKYNQWYKFMEMTLKKVG